MRLQRITLLPHSMAICKDPKTGAEIAQELKKDGEKNPAQEQYTQS